MKRFLLYVALCCSFFAACQSKYNEDDAGGDGNGRKMSQRDYSITKANAYSDLFFDSLVMEQYITQHHLEDSFARRIRSFYNSRNYQYAWFSSDGLTEQARGFWNLHDYVTTYDTALKDKDLQKKMEDMVMQEKLSISSNDKSVLNTELKLTEHFIRYMLGNYEKGYVKRKEMERFVPRKKEDALVMADSLINKKHKDDKYYEDVNELYGGLKAQLKKYHAIAKAGGWPQVPVGKTALKKGMAAPAVAVLKKRLAIEGFMPAGDTSQVYNDTVMNAVKNFQRSLGYTADGVAGPVLLKALNVPAIERLQQLLLNMERMRWTPVNHNGNLILVNIPEFTLHIYEGKKEVIKMAVVVGKESNNTMMFNGDLSMVVFSPYWNVPTSIVQKEIMPAIQRNSGYLDAQNMEIVSNSGGTPVIRQRPGPGNALGQVKFLFPNSFNIYFHDTPSKSLFSRDTRAFSHGCIRLSDPEGMAKYVLRNQPEWTPERIHTAMNAGTEQQVKVKTPIPVIITYYTAWVDETGLLSFRSDIYGHDKKILGKMFAR